MSLHRPKPERLLPDLTAGEVEKCRCWKLLNNSEKSLTARQALTEYAKVKEQLVAELGEVGFDQFDAQVAHELALEYAEKRKLLMNGGQHHEPHESTGNSDAV